MIEQAITLHKLLRLGNLYPAEARAICGWDHSVFAEVLRVGIESGLIEKRRGVGTTAMTTIGAVFPTPVAIGDLVEGWLMRLLHRAGSAAPKSFNPLPTYQGTHHEP